MEAVQESDVAFLMFDARVGVILELAEIARWIRTYCKYKVFLLANKLEGNQWNEKSTIGDNLADIAKLGFGEAIPISALMGEGMSDLAAFINIQEITSSNAEKLLHLEVLGR